MIVDELKQSILQHAFQGKLSEQLKVDSDVDITLNKIAEIKKNNIKDKIFKKTPTGKEILTEEIKYNIPNSWKWVRFIDLCSVMTCGYASTPQYVKDGMPFLSAKNVKPYEFKPQEYKMISKELYRKLTSTCKPERNDILLTRVGAGIGECTIIDVAMDFAIYVSLTLIKLIDYELISNKYILYWLNSPYGISTSLNNITGKDSSQGNLNVDDVRNFLIPFPPIEEQQRIVDKVEELFSKLDEIKSIEDELNKLKLEFPNEMKKSILIYNILKTQNNVELTNYNEKKLPDDWKWVKFSNIADCKMGKTILKKDLMSSGIPVYSATNSDNVLGYINECDLILTKGDLVIPARGNSIGYATFIQEEKATCTQTAIACYPKSIINSKFLYYCCYAFKNIWFKFTGSAIPQITISNINENYIPLPPLEEQQRIVDKLEKLLPLCDDVEKLVGD